MLDGDIRRWRAVLARIAEEEGWDDSLLVCLDDGGGTFRVQVRKSVLSFTVSHVASSSGTFSVAYTGFPTTAAFGSKGGEATRSDVSLSEQVERELEAWLRGSVVRWAEEHELPS